MYNLWFNLRHSKKETNGKITLQNRKKSIDNNRKANVLYVYVVGMEEDFRRTLSFRSPRSPNPTPFLHFSHPTTSDKIKSKQNSWNKNQHSVCQPNLFLCLSFDISKNVAHAHMCSIFTIITCLCYPIMTRMEWWQNSQNNLRMRYVYFECV